MNTTKRTPKKHFLFCLDFGFVFITLFKRKEINMSQKTCPETGEWRQDRTRSESVAPFLKGLGVPLFVGYLLDGFTTDLSITKEGKALTVLDQTWFGTNETRVELGGEEIKRSTKTGRKTFMLSGYEEDDGSICVQCRLHERGDGWYTRQCWRAETPTPTLSKNSTSTSDKTEPSISSSSWSSSPDELTYGTLAESMQLIRPNEPDIEIKRYFKRKDIAVASGYGYSFLSNGGLKFFKNDSNSANDSSSSSGHWTSTQKLTGLLLGGIYIYILYILDGGIISTILHNA